MNRLHIAENIVALRRKKGVTQEELAAFLHVTKASVSKWETRQSYPDILLLPQLAAYFDVRIDDLLGYEPQLSPEQIKKCYLELAEDFSNSPFDAVMERSRKLAKEYYACYPLLLQIALLWLNHFMLTPDREKQGGILKEMIELCVHIRENCGDVGICNSAVELKAAANLLSGNAQETIAELEPLWESRQAVLQTDSALIQAYRMTGDQSKAGLYSQIAIYTHLLGLVSDSIGMLSLDMGDRETCETTIQRLRQVMEAYHLEQLHPNTALQFHYQAAVFYCSCEKKDEALAQLRLFVTGSLAFLENGLRLRGDSYFDRIGEWFEEFALQTEAPRNEKVVRDSLLPAMESPALAILFDTQEYQKLKKQIQRKREGV